MPLLARLRALSLLSTLVVVGCKREPSTGRRFLATQWDTAWRTPGALMDTLLPNLSALGIAGDLVVATDATRPAIVALDLHTGRLRWQLSQRGAGPHDVADPIQVITLSSGVAVLDLGNRRLTHVDAQGVPHTFTSLASAGAQPNDACAYGSDFLSADPYRATLFRLNADGAAIDTLTLPWPDLATAGMWSRQVMLRSDASGERCVLALMSGRGFAIGGPGMAWRLVPYVERFEVTGVGDRADEPPGNAPFFATLDVAFSGDTVLVLFAGRTPDEYRVVDLYAGATGQYLHSLRLPIETSAIAVAGEYLLARLRSDTTATTIVALRRR